MLFSMQTTNKVMLRSRKSGSIIRVSYITKISFDYKFSYHTGYIFHPITMSSYITQVSESGIFNGWTL